MPFVNSKRSSSLSSYGEFVNLIGKLISKIPAKFLAKLITYHCALYVLLFVNHFQLNVLEQRNSMTVVNLEMPGRRLSQAS
jgi:hypothetical protein